MATNSNMGLPFALSLKQCSRGWSNRFPKGFDHHKTAPATIIAQCLEGKYEVWNEGRHAVVEPGGWFVVRAMSPVRIRHHHNEKEQMEARWFHLRIERPGGVDALSGCRLPLHVLESDGKPFAEGWDELDQLSESTLPMLSHALHRKVGYGLLANLIHLTEYFDASLHKGLERFTPVFTYIETNLKEEICVEDLARQVHLSSQHFHAEFKAHTNKTPMAWVQHLRLERAARALLTSADSIQKIAENCGFINPFHFSRIFKNWVGMSPRLWRDQHRDSIV